METENRWVIARAEGRGSEESWFSRCNVSERRQVSSRDLLNDDVPIMNNTALCI